MRRIVKQKSAEMAPKKQWVQGFLVIATRWLLAMTIERHQL